MTLAAILRSLAPTPEAAAVALDRLRPLELAGSTPVADAKARALAGSPKVKAFDPRTLRQLHELDVAEVTDTQ